MMNPTVGTVWSTGTGVTQRSPTRCSASSASVRNLSTGALGEGIAEKSGQSTLLNACVLSPWMTGSTLVAVTGRRAPALASVSVRKARPTTWSRCGWDRRACSTSSCSSTVRAPGTVPASTRMRSLTRNAEGRCPSPSLPKAPSTLIFIGAEF